MPFSNSSTYGLLIVLLLALTLRLPGWFTADAKQRFQLFEPDEMQHVDIALARFQELGPATLKFKNTEIFNVRGYGIVSGHFIYAWSRISGKVPTVGDVVLLNRQLSTLFSLLLILLVYQLGRGFGLRKYYALIAALLLAFCDLNCTYSHYGIPASGYILGVYLTVLGGQRITHTGRDRKTISGLFFLALGASIALAFKFDFLPFALGGLLLLYLQFGDKRRTKKRPPYWFIPVGIGLVILCFGLITGFAWSLDSIVASWQTLREVNQDVVAVDQHWLENPIVYAAAVIAGIGLPAVSLALRGTMDLTVKKAFSRPDFLLLIGILLAEFIVRWSIDTPFVRRANVFMPAVALGAAYGISKLKWKPVFTYGLLAYTALFALVGQSNHWFDPREMATEWINTQIPEEATVAVSPYVQTKGLRKVSQFKPDGDWDYAILHEAYYQRYTLSMTTPFGYPECCAGVYHCQGEAMCTKMQEMVGGSDESVELIKRFDLRHFFPERIIYDNYLGSYETFLGDVLVFRRRGTGEFD